VEIPTENTSIDDAENEVSTTPANGSPTSEAEQTNAQDSAQQPTDAEQPAEADSLLEDNNLSQIEQGIDELIQNGQNNTADGNDIQDINSVTVFSSANQNTFIKPDMNNPEALAQLIQLQAYQDQLANQSLLSETDYELDLEQEEQLLNKINEMHEQIDQDLSSEEEDQVEVQIALGSSVGLTAGFVSWVLRGGSLLASMMSTLPLLNRYDPFPIIKTRKDDKKISTEDEDDTETENESRVDKLFSKKTDDEQ